MYLSFAHACLAMGIASLVTLVQISKTPDPDLFAVKLERITESFFALTLLANGTSTGILQHRIKISVISDIIIRNDCYPSVDGSTQYVQPKHNPTRE